MSQTNTHAQSNMRTAVVAVVVAIALVLPSLSAGQMIATRARELFRNGDPISERLLPGEQLVIIKSLAVAEPPLGIVSPEIELMNLSYFKELLVLDQINVDAYLAYNDTWIRTRVKGRVSQLLNSERLALYPGAPIEFQIDGGEMIIKGVHVVARIPTRDNFKTSSGRFVRRSVVEELGAGARLCTQ